MSQTTRNPRTKRGNKLLITVTIDPDQVQAIDRLADERRTSRSQVVREAVNLFLAREQEREAA